MNKPSKRYEECGAVVIDAIKSGASLDEAARHAGCGDRTVDRWLKKGRLDPRGPYGRFAAQVDGARRAQGIVPDAGEDEVTMTRGELRQVTEKAARNGSVQAMKLMRDFLDEEPEERGPDAVDLLVAARKARRQAAGIDDV
jgi:transposase